MEQFLMKLSPKIMFYHAWPIYDLYMTPIFQPLSPRFRLEREPSGGPGQLPVQAARQSEGATHRAAREDRLPEHRDL